jgi:F-type H+-transporting ATPase subunit epsilon
MAKVKTFRCQLITPEAALAETQATSVVLTAHDGELGVLHNRAPLLSKLGIGRCKIESPQGTQEYFIDGGFLQVLHNQVTILTPNATAVADIDAAEAEKDLQRARAVIAVGQHALEVRAQDIKRATTKLKLAPQH